MDSHLEMDFEDRVSGYHPIGGFPMEDETEEFYPEDPDDVECEGHPVEDEPQNAHGGFGIGEVVYCDGTCRG